MGKLRPAPEGYDVQKDAQTARWYIVERQTDEQGRIRNIQALTDAQGYVVTFPRRALAVSVAVAHAQAMRIAYLEARLAGNPSSPSSAERLLGVS